MTHPGVAYFTTGYATWYARRWAKDIMHPLNTHTGTETCIAAGQIFAAFFLTTTFVQIVSSDTRIEQNMVLLVGALALALIIYRWISKAHARRHLANLSLLIAAFLIGLDMALALEVWSRIP